MIMRQRAGAAHVLTINRVTISKVFGYTMVCLGSKYVQRDKLLSGQYIAIYINP